MLYDRNSPSGASCCFPYWRPLSRVHQLELYEGEPLTLLQAMFLQVADRSISMRVVASLGQTVRNAGSNL